MRKRITPRSFTLILALALAASAFARPGAIATLTGSGAVLVNSVRASQSTAIFDGDTIQTQADSSATLVLRGATAVVSPQSTAFVTADFLELKNGSAEITTMAVIRVQVAGCTIQAGEIPGTRFTAQNTNGKLTVSVQKGQVVLTHLSQRTDVKAGQTAALAPSAGQGFSISANRFPAKTLTGAAVGGGSAVGVTLATRHKKDSISPVQP
jgi:ferric-dicitrate binding protein FerR (iron transport regulator)